MISDWPSLSIIKFQSGKHLRSFLNRTLLHTYLFCEQTRLLVALETFAPKKYPQTWTTFPAFSGAANAVERSLKVKTSPFSLCTLYSLRISLLLFVVFYFSFWRFFLFVFASSPMQAGWHSFRFFKGKN